MTQQENNQSPTEIFKAGSTTFFNSSIFFEDFVRERVTTLYAFVRVIDDYVDCIPQRSEDYYAFKTLFYRSLEERTPSGNPIIDNFVELINNCGINIQWIDAFFESMEMDLNKYEYLTIKDTEKYIYGSAEVIGLMMARIMNLPEIALETAARLGKAFQLINMIRDVNEDLEIGRSYFPKDELEQYGLYPLTRESAKLNPQGFIAFMRFQIDRYVDWQRSAAPGYKYLEYRSKVAVKTAADRYLWTADQIFQHPFVVFDTKVKPSKWRVRMILVRIAIETALESLNRES